MKTQKFTKEESELYLKMVKNGNMDDIFDYGVLVGKERLLKEMKADGIL